jgi:hypothetical protein
MTISTERIEFALKLFEKLEQQRRKDFSIEDAKRRLRILEVLKN